MRFTCFATTVHGLEDIAAGECRELIGVDAKPDVGKIIFEADLEQIIKLNLASRTLHRIFIMLARSQAETLDDVYKIARGIDYSEFINPDQTFAVRGERHSKDKPFTSLDMAAIVGRAVIESFKEKTGTRLKVNLDDPDVELYCLLRDSEFILGLNTTGKSLHRRYYRVYHHRAALQPTIAASMLRISGWEKKKRLLDPMCGGGTIPIEAALIALKIPPGARKLAELALQKLRFIEDWRIEMIAKKLEEEVNHSTPIKIMGTDASPKSIEGALKNAEKAGVLNQVKFLVKDVFKIGEWLEEEPDHILMNPPYGIRMGIRKIEEFYERVCKVLAEAAPNAKLTVIVSKPTIFGRALEKAGYQTTFKRQIVYGKLNAFIISAER